MSIDQLREHQAAQGATFATVGDEEVARHYGDVREEYRAVREGAGIVRRSDRSQLRMWGRDPIKMLNGLITNDLGQLSAERAVYGAMLTPKGRVITEVRAFTRGGGEASELIVDIPSAALQATTEHLRKYVPPLFSRFESISPGFGAIGVYGPRSGELVSRVLGTDVSPEEDQLARGAFDDSEVVAMGTAYAGGEPGFDLFSETEVLAELWEELLRSGSDIGARPVGFAALETLRIEAGRPDFGSELTEEVLPGEVFETTHQMSRAVSFSKGCYTGQEVVIRIAHRGHVNRNVRGLLLGDSTAPPIRTPLFRADAEKEVGWVTSVAQSPLMGQTVALGYLRREVSPGDEVRVGSPTGESARVVDLPFSRE